MSFNITDDANYLGGIDFSDLTKIGKFSNAVIITEEIDPNATEQFTADERNNFVSSVELSDADVILPTIARIISLKINIRGDSTNSVIRVHQSSERREIDRVIQVSDESVNATPNTFLLGGGIGVPFINKDDEEQIYFEIEEKSGNTSEYDIEFNWLNVRR